MYAKKIHQFLSSIKKRCTQKKIGSFFVPCGVVDALLAYDIAQSCSESHE